MVDGSLALLVEHLDWPQSGGLARSGPKSRSAARLRRAAFTSAVILSGIGEPWWKDGS